MKSKRIIAFLCAMVAVFSLCAVPAFASTADSDYSKYMSYTGSWYSVDERDKDTSSKVYVHPTNAPNAVTNVQTWGYSRENGNISEMGTATNFTDATTVFLTSGEYYAVTNYVYESGYRDGSAAPMWLRVKPNLGSGTVAGVWSPDWSGRTQYGDYVIIIK